MHLLDPSPIVVFLVWFSYPRSSESGFLFLVYWFSGQPTGSPGNSAVIPQIYAYFCSGLAKIVLSAKSLNESFHGAFPELGSRCTVIRAKYISAKS